MRARALLVAPLAGLLLVPAASASRPHGVKLALVPLPKSALGPAARTFSVAHDSGPVSNAEAAAHTPDATPGTFKRLGRLGGYALEYGNAFTGDAGITDVRTSIEHYKTPADARRALAFWKKEDARLRRLNNPNFSVTSVRVKLPAPARGTSHFAYLTSYSAANIVPVSGIEEQIADGRYVLGVIVTAGTASDAVALAPKLAQKLDARFRLARKGRLHSKPVKLPKQVAAPPPGGPDLSALALRQSDFVGKVTVSKRLRRRSGGDLGLQRLHADARGEAVLWSRSGDRVVSRRLTRPASSLISRTPRRWRRTPWTVPLDLSGLGDGAQASIGYGPLTEAGNWASVFFSNGQLAEGIFIAGTVNMSADDVTKVAQAAAKRIDAPGSGRSYAPTTWTSQRRSRSRSSSMKRTRCHVPSWSSPSRTGTDSPAVPSSIAMQCEWPLP